MNIIAKWKEMREGLRKFYSITLVEIANNHGLAVEYVPELPVRVDGFLDRHEMPRFIAVNSTLHPVDQSYAICREVSRWRQERRLDSMVLSSPKRWQLFDNAPEPVRNRIGELDLEQRAMMMLAFWGKGSEYFVYHKRKPSKIFRTGCITLVTDFLFLLLRIRKFCHQVCWPFRAAIRAF